MDLFKASRSSNIHWSVPWSDLMMTMFILFAVLFAYHVSEQGRFAAKNIKAAIEPHAARTYRPDPAGPRMENTPPAMDELLQISKQAFGPQGLQGVARVHMDEDGALMIVLTSDVLFDSGRAELKQDSLGPLRQVARIVRDTPYIVNIIGHTDDVVISNEQFSSNWELSTARACVTARYMIEAMGIAPDRIYAAGHAEFDPVASNRTPAGRAANRRVEIIISRQTPYLNSGGRSSGGRPVRPEGGRPAAEGIFLDRLIETIQATITDKGQQ